MTERPSQSADGSGIAQADNGATATVNYSTHHHYAPEPARPTRAIHLNPPPALFIGREPELAALHQHLAREGSVAYIPGFPGRGKSTLANFYAHQHKDEYQTVHWLPCHSKSLVEIAAEFASQLELKLDGDLEANLKHLRSHCARNRCLLILDNVDDEAPAGMLLGGRSSVLITTQRTDLDFLSQVAEVPLRVFTEEQCFDLFRSRVGAKEVDTHIAETRSLFERLEHHPFAIEIAARLIRKDLRHTIASMATNLPTSIPDLFAKAVAALSPDAQSLLAAMAACAPEGFRLSLAAEIAGFDEDAAFQALNQICSRSLAEELDRDTHRYRLHALVRTAAKATEAHHALHANSVIAQFERWEVNWRGCAEDIADWRAAFEWSFHQPGNDAWTTENRLAFNGYSLTRRLGRLTEAYEISSLMIKRAACNSDQIHLQAWLGNHALVLQDWGQLKDAIALHRWQEAICVEFGHKAGLQASYGNQALILKDMGQLDAAMTLHKHEEALCIELEDKAGLHTSYGNQALIFQDLGRLDDAMNLHKQQEALCIELGDKAGMAVCYGNQALILDDWEQADNAMTLLKRQEVLSIELGDKAGLSRCYGNQALILIDCVQIEDAITLLRRQEALCIELNDKAGLAICSANQGIVARLQGNTKMERENLQQALNLYIQVGMPREQKLVQDWLDRANGLAEPEPS